MDFPMKDLLDPQACYDQLAFLLHPEGLCCPHGDPLAQCCVHKRDRAPVGGLPLQALRAVLQCPHRHALARQPRGG